jgi:DNA modification methylase
MTLPKPFYERNGITLYCADSRELLPLLKCDLLLTDPPYGLGVGGKRWNGGKGRKKTYTGFLQGQAPIQTTDFGVYEWDNATPPAWMFQLMMEQTTHQIIFGGNYFSLPPSQCWLIWDKMNGATSYADCELIWTSFKKSVRKFEHRWNGFLQEPGHKEKRYHRTQKPVRVLQWCIAQAPDDVQTILDPFAGSGSTLVAAIRSGKRAIGIEREPDFCKVAVERLEAEFATASEQTSLGLIDADASNAQEQPTGSTQVPH